MSKHFKNHKAVIDQYVRGVTLDVGFYGQGIKPDDPRWPHAFVKQKATKTFGVDIADGFQEDAYYQRSSADAFSFKERFDTIIAMQLIEHLVNPGKFLETCRDHLAPGGIIVITTDNAYNINALAGKLTREDPVANPDHTLLLNPRHLRVLAGKCGLRMHEYGYIYDSVGEKYKESLRKRILNALYYLIAKATHKYEENFFAVLMKA